MPSIPGDLFEGNDFIASLNSDIENGLLMDSLSSSDKHRRLSREKKESIADMSPLG